MARQSPSAPRFGCAWAPRQYASTVCVRASRRSHATMGAEAYRAPKGRLTLSHGVRTGARISARRRGACSREAVRSRSAVPAPGRSAAEPCKGEAAIVGVEPERARQVAARPAVQDEWKPVGRVVGPAQRAGAAYREAPREAAPWFAELHPAVGMALALAFRPLAPPARRRVDAHGRRGHPADPRRDVGDRPVQPCVRPVVAAGVPGGAQARRGLSVEPVTALDTEAEIAKVHLVGEPAAGARSPAGSPRWRGRSASAGRDGRPRTSGRTRRSGTRGARNVRRPRAAASASSSGYWYSPEAQTAMPTPDSGALSSLR